MNPQPWINKKEKFRSFKSKENIHKKERRWARLYHYGTKFVYPLFSWFVNIEVSMFIPIHRDL